MNGASAGRSGNKRPSMFEVARLAGVSHQTVSRVVNNSPDVSAATRAKVEQAIAQLGYRRSNSARALASNRSRTIGLIASSINYYGPINTLASIETGIRRHDMFLSVGIVPETEFVDHGFHSVSQSFSEQDVDAFVFITPTDEMLLAALRMDAVVPRVILTSTHGNVSITEAVSLSGNNSNVTLVGIDQWSAMHNVADLLARHGHRHALYVPGPDTWRDAVTRRVAWTRHANELGIATHYLRTASWDATDAYQAVTAAIDEYQTSGEPLPTAIVAANDNQAVGALRALHEHGLRVPQDVSVVGFDDIPGADNYLPPLTTVHPRFGELGVTAAKSLLSLLGETEAPQFERSEHDIGLVSADLIIRDSVGPAPTR